jgi:hypothetical protein
MSMFTRFKYKGGNLSGMAGLGASMSGTVMDRLKSQKERLETVIDNITNALNTMGSSLTDTQRARLENYRTKLKKQHTAVINSMNAIARAGNRPAPQPRQQTVAEQLMNQGIRAQVESGQNSAGASTSAYGGEY